MLAVGRPITRAGRARREAVQVIHQGRVASAHAALAGAHFGAVRHLTGWKCV